ncbi:MAG TPA: response regulator transcription factor [Ktedonobacteraceae bacterium]|nr:response regulator transcription factor [Ktedonobacteraceae bacterium]
MRVDLDQETEQRSPECAASTLPRPITVLIMDDHALIRAAISQVLAAQPEVERIGMAQNYAEAEKQAAQLRPEIIWLDLHMAHADSSAEIGRLRKVSPASRILALDDIEDEQEAFAAIMAGAQGYRSKEDVDPEEIMPMIQVLCRGEFVLRPALLARLLQRLRAAALPRWEAEKWPGRHPSVRAAVANRFAELTAREREILQSISQGYRDREIARGLHISEKTVQKHVQGILGKLGVQNRTEAAYLIHCQSACEK